MIPPVRGNRDNTGATTKSQRESRNPDAAQAAHRLRLAAATVEVDRAFERAGINCVLLKGAGLASWLYTDGAPRTFNDIDLLIRPADRTKAAMVLKELGFAPHVDEHAMHEALVQHATEWVRLEDAVEIDLHRTVPGVHVSEDRLWDTLSAHVQRLEVGGTEVTALNTGGLAFHLALHIAQHGEGEYGWHERELEVAVARAEPAVWREAAEIASELSAEGAMGTGLRMVPGGTELASRLGLTEQQSVDVALRAAKAPPVAFGLEQLASARDLRSRIAILRHKIAPPVTFMRAWSPRASRGRLGLVLAYLWRPLWLLARTPAGARAWLRARQRTRASEH
jgi:hypothetical protein